MPRHCESGVSSNWRRGCLLRIRSSSVASDISDFVVRFIRIQSKPLTCTTGSVEEQNLGSHSDELANAPRDWEALTMLFMYFLCAVPER